MGRATNSFLSKILDLYIKLEKKAHGFLCFFSLGMFPLVVPCKGKARKIEKASFFSFLSLWPFLNFWSFRIKIFTRIDFIEIQLSQSQRLAKNIWNFEIFPLDKIVLLKIFQNYLEENNILGKPEILEAQGPLDIAKERALSDVGTESKFDNAFF